MTGTAVAGRSFEERLGSAYEHCRAIARAEAKNFYYAFRTLPEHKRNAICAVYAFMRRADDFADSGALPVAERRLALDRWLADWHAAVAEHESSNPVFCALLDTERRFHIPLELFDQLVEGTAADLLPAEGGGSGAEVLGFATFDQLYRYCYLVASVVGLVTIRVFGYSDPRAEKLAEETGIAFQLTNILRDVGEDARRGRVYLPIEDLDRCGVSMEELVSLASSPARALTANQRTVMMLTAERAEAYYESARKLMPLIDADSRPALWVLVSIYWRLLRRIESRRFEVFTTRVSLPAYEKLAWMGWGLAKLLLAHVGNSFR